MPRAGLDKDTHDVAAMFDAVADRYDRTNDVLSMYQDRAWRRATLDALAVGRGDTVLDLAAGTGTSAAPLADRGVRVVACDLSLGMLTVGRRRRPDVAFVAGDATGLPFADGVFDAVTISFGLRNVPDVDAALAEMLRVTRPGGRLVVCEFSRPTNTAFRAVYDRYLAHALPRIAGVVARESDAYTYLADSITAWPDQRELGRRMRAAGWASVAFRNLTGGVVALHRGFRPAGDEPAAPGRAVDEGRHGAPDAARHETPHESPDDGRNGAPHGAPHDGRHEAPDEAAEGGSAGS